MATPLPNPIPARTLPDDTLEYTLFLLPPTTTPAARARLTEIKTAADALVAGWAGDYIWQRQGFSLRLEETGGVGGDAGAGTCCLKGRTEYGDAVDDEWFVVWMLREVSRRFTDVWIRVYDTDGEFLLIEAANALPRWLNPEIADHRVWLNSGHLLLIPLSASPTSTTGTPTAPISRPLTLPDALTALHSPSKLTRIRLVEEEAFYRLNTYPSSTTTHHHHARTLLPRTLAQLLHTHPSAVAAAVEAFYLRDPISLRCLNAMHYFPPADLVPVTTRFTRVLYAQLKSQEFDPPAAAGFSAYTEADSAADVGAKLTCGFEMLLADSTAPTSASRRDTVGQIRAFLAAPGTPPTDAELAAWGAARGVDDEAWLDVDYTAFEDTLQGGKSRAGWGDKGVEGNLERMVERFEAFLNDDGGEEEMDRDNDDDTDSDEEDGEDDDDEEEEEDREISFDEVEFEAMMREMMGLPKTDTETETGAKTEEAEIREMMARVEAELREAGALEKEAPPAPARVLASTRLEDDEEEDEEDEDEDAELNIDYTLAKNMLESFKGQAGMAGPAGNLLARMGIVLPRDDPRGDEKEEEAGGKGKGKGREGGDGMNLNGASDTR